MAKLAIETKTTHHIDWLTYAHVRDKGCVGLDELCAEVYGTPIDLGGGNDTDYSVTVKKEAIESYDEEDLADIISGGYLEDYQLSLLMTDLCNRGHIEPGSYVVSMSW